MDTTMNEGNSYSRLNPPILKVQNSKIVGGLHKRKPNAKSDYFVNLDFQNRFVITFPYEVLQKGNRFFTKRVSKKTQGSFIALDSTDYAVLGVYPFYRLCAS